MLYLKWCGGAVVMLIAFLVRREYGAYIRRRLGEGEGVLRLLLHMEKMISSYLAKGGELFCDFSDEWLEKLGLLPLLREGVRPREALRQVEGKSLLPDGIKGCLLEYFRTFGEGYRDSELARLRGCLSEVEKMLATEREECERYGRVASALALGGALGLVILII